MTQPEKPPFSPQTPLSLSPWQQLQHTLGHWLGKPDLAARGVQNNIVWRGGVQVMRMDLHTHTEVSADCQTPLRDIPSWMLRTNTRVVAVTDHDEYRGGPALRQIVQDMGLDAEEAR